MSSRDDIATALNGASLGLNVSTHYRQTLKPFDGFVKWNGRTPDSTGLGWINSWQVWLALPQDVKAAEVWLDTNLDALVQALHTEVYVTSVNPAELLIGDGAAANGLILEGSLPASA